MNDDRMGCVGILAVVALLATACVSIYGEGLKRGRHQATDEFRAEAVKAGVAEWRVDPKTGETRFEFGGRER